MPDIGAHLNVYNTALVVLERKGWSLRYEKSREWWFAKKGEWEFLADDPMQLLGLVAIYEHHAPKKKEERRVLVEDRSAGFTFEARPGSKMKKPNQPLACGAIARRRPKPTRLLGPRFRTPLLRSTGPRHSKKTARPQARVAHL